MTKLYELTKLIRSKNAGPFQLTFDIFCNNKKNYEKVKNSKALSKKIIAHIYNTPIDDVIFFECDDALAFKASIPRPVFQGDIGDTDNHGGQQYAPLMDIEIKDLDLNEL